MTTPMLTICIMHYKKLSKLKKTIEHIKAHTNIPYKIKLLNQEFLDDAIEKYLAQLKKEENIDVLYNTQNIGPSGGRAILFDQIETPLVMSIDDDIYLPPNWFDEIDAFFKTNQSINVVGLLLIAPDGTLLDSALDLRIIKRNTLIVERYAIPSENKKISENFFEVDDVLEGAMILRKSVAQKIIWDPAYTVALEGIDKGLQLKELGTKVALYTGIRAIHDSVSTQSNAKEYNLIRRDYHEIRKNYLHLSKKWNVKLPFLHHLYYKYICRVFPRKILRKTAYFWLNILKPFLRKTGIEWGKGGA